MRLIHIYYIFKLINNSNIFNISLCGFLHSVFCVVVLFICLFVILSHTFNILAAFPPFIVLSTQTSVCCTFVCALCRLIMVKLFGCCCFMDGKCHSSCPDVFISVVIIAKVL